MSLTYQRKISIIDNSLAKLELLIMVEGTEAIGDITGPFFRLIFCERVGGDCFWKQDNDIIRAKENFFALYVPPNSIVEDIHVDCQLKVKTFLGKAKVSSLNKPILFYPETKTFPENVTEISELLKSVQSYTDISRSLTPNSLAVKTKEAIESQFQQDISLGQLAKDAKVSASTLTQYFKKSYGISPVKYRRALRIETALFNLIMGKRPAEAAFESGYQDLGRFYKQFREILMETPGAFNEMTSCEEGSRMKSASSGKIISKSKLERAVE